MNLQLHGYLILGVCTIFFVPTDSAWAATLFTNQGGIVNTRHNLSQSSLPDATAVMMDGSRNNYGEVCVYCHTPHGANQAITAPLWNRTIKATTFQTYNTLGTSSLTQTVRQPGGSSLTCLSCHDGQTAVDSIINMPGSWRKQVGQANQYDLSGINSTTPGVQQQVQYKLSAQFLDTWNNPARPGLFPKDTLNHQGLNSNMTATSGKAIGPVTFPDGLGGTATGDIGCMSCHSPNGLGQPGRTDFNLFVIGTDLRNDHPVGVTYPAAYGPEKDWKIPDGSQGNAHYFDAPGGNPGKMDKGDIRVYGTGQGGANGATAPTVECASCHDPHGVPDMANGSTFYPTFLRVSNAGSRLCLTCHTK